MKLGFWIWGLLAAVLAVRGFIAFAHDGIAGPVGVVVLIAFLAGFKLID